MLDTDTCSYAMKRTFHDLVEKIRNFAPGELKVSTVTAYELEYGARKSGRFEQLNAVIRAFLQNVEILPFDLSAAREAGMIRAELARAGSPIGAYDLMIAGHARALSAALLTHNVRVFSRVSGISVEDWARQ